MATAQIVPDLRESPFHAAGGASRARLLAAVAGFFFLAIVGGAGRASTLDFDSALRLAEERSRQLTAQEAAAAASRQMAMVAGQRPDPVLKAGINNLPVDGPDRFSLTRDFMTMRSVGVMQELTGKRKLQARSDRFERAAEVAEAGRWLALAELQRDTATAWLERHHEEQLRAMLLAQRDEARLQIDAADAAYRGGRGSQADVFVARSAVAQIEDALAQAERRVATAQIRLARWVGLPGAETLGPVPALDTVRLRDDSLEALLAHHPRLEVMARQEAEAQALAEVERTNRRPDVSVELMYSQRGSAYSNMVSVNLSVPLPWDRARRQDRELAARLATVEQLRAEREEATRVHVAEVQSMLQEWRSHRARLERYDTSLLPLAGERTRATLAAYRGGSAPLAAVLESRRAEIETRTERLRLAMEAARLWAQLEYLLPAGREAAAAALPSTGKAERP